MLENVDKSAVEKDGGYTQGYTAPITWTVIKTNGLQNGHCVSGWKDR